MQTKDNNRNHDHGNTPEDLIGALIAIVIGVAILLWLGAQLASLIASGTPLPASPDDLGIILWNTVTENRSEPANAWPEPHSSHLPGPWLYWTTTILVFGALAGLGLGVRKILADSGQGLDDVERLGSPAEARLATRKEIKPLRITEPTPGHYPLGTVDGHVIASESRNSEGNRRTIAGPVAYFGASQSGKTSDVVAALKNWEGPAIVLSVKGDLAEKTIGLRQQLGEVQIFDPSGFDSSGLTGTWNPLDRCDSWESAQRLAKRLIDATDQAGNSSGKFWSQNSIGVLAAFLWLAKGLGKQMADVNRWIIGMDEPTEDGPGEVASYLKTLAGGDESNEAVASFVANELRGLWKIDSKMKASYYVTLRSAVAPWSRASVQAATESTSVSVIWLTERNHNNTVYITSPLIDQEVLAPVISAFVADIVDSFMEFNQKTSYVQKPEVLLLLDETANMAVPQLPRWASTLAGLGVQLVTVWQDVSQLQTKFGEGAKTILGNSRSIILYGGCTDPATFQFVEQLTGSDFHEARLSRLPELGSSGIRDMSLVPPHVLRQMHTDDRLLIQSNFPLIQMKTLSKMKKKWR